jgi:hypothetical protein
VHPDSSYLPESPVCSICSDARPSPDHSSMLHQLQAAWIIQATVQQRCVAGAGQCKSSYEDNASGLVCRSLLPPSPQEYPMTGLNLMRLLVENRIAEFHTELELIPDEVRLHHKVQQCRSAAACVAVRGALNSLLRTIVLHRAVQDCSSMHSCTWWLWFECFAEVVLC